MASGVPETSICTVPQKHSPLYVIALVLDLMETFTGFPRSAATGRPCGRSHSLRTDKQDHLRTGGRSADKQTMTVCRLAVRPIAARPRCPGALESGPWDSPSCDAVLLLVLRFSLWWSGENAGRFCCSHPAPRRCGRSKVVLSF